MEQKVSTNEWKSTDWMESGDNPNITLFIRRNAGDAVFEFVRIINHLEPDDNARSGFVPTGTSKFLHGTVFPKDYLRCCAITSVMKDIGFRNFDDYVIQTNEIDAKDIVWNVDGTVNRVETPGYGYDMEPIVEAIISTLEDDIEIDTNSAYEQAERILQQRLCYVLPAVICRGDETASYETDQNAEEPGGPTYRLRHAKDDEVPDGIIVLPQNPMKKAEFRMKSDSCTTLFLLSEEK